MVRGVHCVIRLALQLERPVPQSRRSAAGAQRIDQRERPQVLMNVGVHAHLEPIREPFH